MVAGVGTFDRYETRIYYASCASLRVCGGVTFASSHGGWLVQVINNRTAFRTQAFFLAGVAFGRGCGVGCGITSVALGAPGWSGGICGLTCEGQRYRPCSTKSPAPTRQHSSVSPKMGGVYHTKN